MAEMEFHLSGFEKSVERIWSRGLADYKVWRGLAEALLLFPMHLLQPLLSHYPSAPLIEPVVWPCAARGGR